MKKKSIIIILCLAVAFFVGWRFVILKKSSQLKVFDKKTDFLISFDKKTDIASNQKAVSENNFMIISSPAFEIGGNIPEQYTCDGDNMSPPLRIKTVPEGTKSLVLVMDDPDSPLGNWIHWTVWNIKPETTVIESGSVPSGAIEGLNSFGEIGYGGPCPPEGTHRYFFKLFALDIKAELKSGAIYQELEQMMAGHILARAELVGRYERRPLW